jgi:hypothetical protein
MHIVPCNKNGHLGSARVLPEVVPPVAYLEALAQPRTGEEDGRMRRFPGLERGSCGQIYDGMGLELWACADAYDDIGALDTDGPADADDVLLSRLEDGPSTNRPHLSFDTAFAVSTGGTSIGEDLNQWIPFLPHRSTLSYNHPNPFTATTTMGFSLPRASSAGTAVYEATALLANIMMRRPTHDDDSSSPASPEERPEAPPEGLSH